MGIIGDAWNILTGRSGELAEQQRLKAQQQQQRDDEARRRFATQGAMVDGPSVPRAEPAPKEQASGTPHQEMIDKLRNQYIADWQVIVQQEADQNSYLQISALGGKIAAASGKKFDELTDTDFSRLGLRKDEFTSVLSRVAMGRAVEDVKKLADGFANNDFTSMRGIEGMLADTEYARKGGMKHATEVMLSLSGRKVSYDRFVEYRKEVGQSAAEELGKLYKASKALFTAEARDFIVAIEMAGENPSDTRAIQKYTGDTKENFLRTLGSEAGESLARGDKSDYQDYTNIKARLSRSR